jgi:acyl transferase domain-containing protein
LWQLLLAGVDAVSIRSPDEWLPPRFSGPAGAALERAMSHPGGFLDRGDQTLRVAGGDPSSLVPTIDPQQTLFLQCATEALAHSELRARDLAGKVVGVFAGATNLDYHRWLYADPQAVSLVTYLASAPSAISNRTSWNLDVRGPSMTIDTACSSGLIAIHLARRSLLSSESDICLAGGVNVILNPDSMLTFLASGLLSSSGRCRVFSADADGYIRAEGCGVLVLTTLRYARAAGLPVRALVLASAVNHTGRSAGLAMPRVSAQADVMLRAYQTAGVSPESVGYIEAHAVGTQVGDIMELKALERVFAARLSLSRKLPVGSLKTNFGHSEPASGVAGLLKAIFVATERRIPPNLHFREINPRARKALEVIHIPNEPEQMSAEARVVGVSAFGATGANGHVVISAA